MKNYIQPGQAVTVTATAAVTSGALVAIGALVGFAQTDAAEGQDFAIVTEGVFRVDVVADADVEVGDAVYLDDQTLTTASDDGAEEDPAPLPRAGVVTLGGSPDAETGLAEVHVKINA